MACLFVSFFLYFVFSFCCCNAAFFVFFCFRWLLFAIASVLFFMYLFSCVFTWAANLVLPPSQGKGPGNEVVGQRQHHAGLIPLLVLPSTLMRHVNGALVNLSSNRRNLKTPAFRFCVEGKHLGCLPFTRKNRSVDSCSEWYASNPKWKFSVGCARSISTTFSQKIGSKAIQAKRPGTSKKTANGTHISIRKFRLGILVYLSRNPVFSPRKFPFGETKFISVSIYIPSEISGFQFWVNGKQPLRTLLFENSVQ